MPDLLPPIHSLLARLIWRVVMLIVLTFAIMGGVVWYTVQSTTDTLRDRDLIGQASDIVRHLDYTENGGWALTLPPALEAAYSAANGVYRYAVVDEGATVLLSSTPSGPALGPLDQPLFRVLDPATRRFSYGANMPVIRNGKTVTVQVSQGPQHADVLEDTLLEEMIDEGGWLLLGFMVVLIGLMILTLRTSLAPLRALSAQAAQIGPQTPDVRLPESALPAEVIPLVRAVNQALNRLEAGFRMQREFTANAAHELRTPLAILRADLDNLDQSHAIVQLKADVDALSRLVSQLLRVAQLESITITPDSHVDLHDVAISEAAYLAPLAVREGKGIAVIGESPNVIHGHAEALGHAVRNLIENALRYTPTGTEVELDVSQSACLTVRDYGPGVPPADREAVFRRFWRAGHERRTSGAGLGLSIVKTIAELHGGSITVTDAPGGGALFTLTFPAVS